MDQNAIYKVKCMLTCHLQLFNITLYLLQASEYFLDLTQWTKNHYCKGVFCPICFAIYVSNWTIKMLWFTDVWESLIFVLLTSFKCQFLLQGTTHIGNCKRREKGWFCTSLEESQHFCAILFLLQKPVTMGMKHVAKKIYHLSMLSGLCHIFPQSGCEGVRCLDAC